MGTDKQYQITDLGKLMPQPKQVERIGTGEVGFLVAAIKDLHDVRIGDTVTDAANPAAEALPGYKPIQQMVYLRFLSRRHDPIRRAARRHGPPAAQRQQLHLRPGIFRRPGLRIPLRIPGPVAHGDHPGAARARIPHRDRPDRPHRHLRNQDDRRHRQAHRRPQRTAQSHAGRGNPRAVHPDEPHPPRRQRRRDDEAVRGPPRDLQENRIHRRDARDSRLRDAAGGGDLRFLRPPQKRHPRIRDDGLRPHRLPAPAIWSRWISSSTATASMP